MPFKSFFFDMAEGSSIYIHAISYGDFRTKRSSASLNIISLQDAYMRY